MTTRIKLRRDTAANWLAANPILAAGEPGLETDTGKIKYGDGVTAYALLPHAGSDQLVNNSSVTVQTGDNTKWLVQLGRDSDNISSYNGISANSVIYDNDGNVVVQGSIFQTNAYNMIVAKYTPAGVCMWKKSLNQVSSAYTLYPEGGLTVDSANNILVSYADSENGDYGLLKVAPNGTTVWSTLYNNSSTAGVISGIATDSNDDIFITTWNPNPSGELGLTKINKTTGLVIWTKILSNESAWAAGATVTVDYLDNVIVTGYQGVIFNNENSEVVVAKFDNNGNLTWQKKLAMPDAAVDRKQAGPAGADVDALGNIYVTGSYQVGNGNADANGEAGYSMTVFVTKLNTSGVVQWSRRVGPGPCFWTGLSTSVGNDGDLYLAAATVAYAYRETALGDNTNYEKGEYEQNLVIARYTASTGDVVWQKYFNNKHQQVYQNNNEFGGNRSIDVRGDKLVIAGTSQFAQNFGNGNIQGDNFKTAWVAQLSTDGSVGFDLADFSFADSRVPGRRVTTLAQINTTLVANNGSTVAVDGGTPLMVEAPISTRVIRSKSHTWTFNSEGSVHTPVEGNIVLDQTEQGYINFVGFEYNDMDRVWLQSVVGDTDGYSYAIGADQFNNRRTTIYKFDPLGKTVWITQLRSGSGASFNISRADSVYTVDSMNYGGQNYRAGDEIIIQGYNLEGESPLNDLIIEVLTEDNGNIQTYEIQSGVAAAGTGTYNGQEDNNDDGNSRPIAITIDPTTGNLCIIGETYEYNNNTSILKLVVDPESGAILANTELRSTGNNDLYPYDVQVNSAGVTAIAGQSYGDMVLVTAIDPEAASGLGHMIVGKEGIAIAAEGRVPGNSSGSDWYVSGTGIAGKAYVENFNEYLNVPVVTVQGQGSPTFTITGSGGNYTAATTVTNGGTGGYLSGHKLTVLGSLLGGVDITNDAELQVITVDASGIITQADVISGTSAADNTYVSVAATNYQVGSGAAVGIQFDAITGTVNYAYTITGGDNYTYGDALIVAGSNFAGSTSPANDIRLSVTYTSNGGSGTQGGLGNLQWYSTGVYSDTLGGTINTDWLSLAIQNYNTTNFASTGAWNIYEALDGQAYIWTPDFQKSLGVLGGNDWFTSVAWQGTSTVYAAGASHNTTTGNDENLLVKFSSTGTVAWKKQLTHADYGANDERITAIATHDDGVVAVGRVYDASSDFNVSIMYKLANDGTLMWHKQIRLLDDEYVASALTIDPATGDILVVAGGYNNAVDWDIIYINKFDRDGNIIWKRKLFTGRGEGINEDNGYRAVSIAGDSFFLTGWTYWAQDSQENGFAARLPLDGTGLGEHGIWTYAASDDNNVRTYNKTGTTTIVDHDIVVQAGDKIVDNNTRYYYTDWANPRIPVLNQVVRNGKGGAIVFPDGTRQTTSAAVSQQVKMSKRYTITPDDAGAHIYIDSTNQNGDHYVYIPYWEFVKLPVGFKFSVINRSSSTVYIEIENGPNQQGAIYGSTNKGQYPYTQWYVNGNSDFGSWTELIKVREGNNNSINSVGAEWIIRGDDVQSNN